MTVAATSGKVAATVQEPSAGRADLPTGCCLQPVELRHVGK